MYPDVHLNVVVNPSVISSIDGITVDVQYCKPQIDLNCMFDAGNIHFIMLQLYTSFSSVLNFML